MTLEVIWQADVKQRAVGGDVGAGFAVVVVRLALIDLADLLALGLEVVGKFSPRTRLSTLGLASWVEW